MKKLQTYTDEVGKFSVDYPASWTIETKLSSLSPTQPTSYTTLTSPDGTVLKLGVGYGGKGGGCEPAPGDVPHAKNNECPTLEYLSKRELPTLVYGDINNRGKPYPVYVMTTRYTNAPKGESTYSIALYADNSHTRELNKPEMGFLLAHSPFHINEKATGKWLYYLEAAADSSDPKFFESADGKAVIGILETFRL